MFKGLTARIFGSEEEVVGDLDFSPYKYDGKTDLSPEGLIVNGGAALVQAVHSELRGGEVE
jgi:hypothetical protein